MAAKAQKLLAGDDVPDSSRVVVAGRAEPLAVGTEGDRHDDVGVPHQVKLSARLGVPECDCAQVGGVSAADGDSVSSGLNAQQ